MIKLLNGNGQLGSILSDKIKSIEVEKDILIYHTWNVWDRGQREQEIEYLKFKNFVDQNKNNSKIVFISTCSENENYYVHYKQKSEAYLILNSDDCLVIKFPNLIGKKGIFQRLKNKTAEPYGIMDILSLEEAADKIIDLLSYQGLVKSFTVSGEKIKASTLNKIIHAFDEG